VNVNEIDDVNSTPIIYAVLYNKLNSINYLIENGANLLHEDFLGNSALNLAHNLKIEYLIQKFETLQSK
jgi:ankyrin repeat protein